MIYTSKIFKKKLYNCIILLLIYFPFYSQVGINTSTPLATFDIKQTTYSGTIDMNTPVPGFIAPRMKTSDLVSFLNSGGQYSSAHSGAMIYIESADVDVTTIGLDSRLTNIKNPGYYFFDGTTFTMYASSEQYTLLDQPWYNATTGMGATSNTENIYQNAQVGIGKAGIIDSNAQLEVSSTSKGILIPRLSKVQRDAMVNPAISMMIWNTDESCFNFYKDDNVGWKSVCENNSAADFSIANCSNAYTTGTYTVGTPVDNTNYILLTVNVTQKGTYNIEGITTIGVFFQRNGSFPSEGIYTISIPAFGTPTVSTADLNPPTTTDNVELIINGSSTSCEIKINTINPPTITYEILSAVAPIATIDKGIGTNGKTVDLLLNVTVAGTTSLIAEDTQSFGVTYTAYNQNLAVGNNQVVTLQANGGIVPSSYAGSNIDFKTTGQGAINNPDFTFNVGITNTNATASCTNISVNGIYVAGKTIAAGSTATVTVNVTTPGNYTFTAENTASNIKFTASGGFSTTGTQTFTATASLISGTNITENINNYSFTSAFNSTPFCSFSLDVIYPSTNILFYTQNANQVRLAMTPGINTNNFSPTGTFKTEPTNNIYDVSSWTLSSATLLNYINNQNVQIIVIPTNVSIPDDAQQVLANFITKKKGTVLFTAVGEQAQAGIVKTLIQKTYPTNNATVTANNFGGQYLQAYILQGDATNPYLNGPFGNLINKFYMPYNYNRTPDIVLSNASTVLKSLVKLPNAPILSARDALIYSDTPGLFILPGDNATLGSPNILYGNYSPIQPNTQSINVYTYSGTPTTTSVYPTQTLTPGLVINWVLYGNIMAEFIKHTYNNYEKNVTITALP